MYHRKSLKQFEFSGTLSAAEESLCVAMANDGDADCMDFLVRRYQLYINNLCHKLTGGIMKGALEEDIIGYANLGLMEAIRDFDPTRKVRLVTLIRLRVRSRVLDYTRKEYTHGSLAPGSTNLTEPVILSEEPDPLETLEKHSDHKRLHEILAKHCTEEEATLVRLRYLENKTVKSIGKIFGRSPSWVNRRLEIALIVVRENMSVCKRYE